MKPQKYHKLLLTNTLISAVREQVLLKHGQQFYDNYHMHYHRVLSMIWRFTRDKDDFGYNKIHSMQFRKVTWIRIGSRQLADIIKQDLIEAKIIESDNSYWHGDNTRARPKGYKFTEKLTPKTGDIKVVECSEPDGDDLLQAFGRHRLHIKNVRALKVDYDGATTFIREAIRTRRRIRDDSFGRARYMTSEIGAYWYLQVFDIHHGKFWFVKNDMVGRAFSNATNFPSLLRQYLYFEEVGDSVIIDVVNSQPLLINALMKADGVEDPAFKLACESGTFYESLASVLPSKERRIVKTFVFKEILYGEIKKADSKLMKHFKTLYPVAYEFIKKQKGGKHDIEVMNPVTKKMTIVQRAGNAAFAIKMQVTEADIILGALEEINRKYIQAVSIHDAILVRKKDEAEVKSVMLKHFQRHGLTPRFN